MGLGSLIRRNCKLFFKDRGMFFTSLITPIILLVLYVTFLGNVYKEAFSSTLATGVKVDESIINAIVGGQLVSSLLAVCCVTIAFCSNLLMVQDKITGAKSDITMAPVKPSVISMGYFFSTAISTFIICVIAMVIGLVYLGSVGWYLSVSDVFSLIIDVILLILFGTALSSIISAPLSTTGQSSAVGTIVSAGYGFICGAYMPISNFSDGLQKVLSFLPGTYGTSLLRNHALNGVFNEMSAIGFPAKVLEEIKDNIDCNLYFFGNKVETNKMYIILGSSVVVLIILYVLLSSLMSRNNITLNRLKKLKKATVVDK